MNDYAALELAHRAVSALERIADSLAKLANPVLYLNPVSEGTLGYSERQREEAAVMDRPPRVEPPPYWSRG